MRTKDPKSTELSNAIAYLTSLQKNEGCVVGEVVWCSMITAQYIITAYITQQKIPQDRKDKFIKYFQYRQTDQGGWGLHSESESFVFTTALAYISLRLLGVPANNIHCKKARNWLHTHGGILHIPTWGKFLLALLNLYQWEGLSPILPEMWILPEWFPFHPKRMYRHNRLIYLAMSYLYAIKFQIPANNLIHELRNELYTKPYEKINFRKHCFCIAPTDVYIQPAKILKMIYRGLSVYEKFHSTKKRQNALRKIQDHVIYHQQHTKYVAINPINGLFNVLVLYHLQHEYFLPSFQAMDYWFWEDDNEGLRMMGATSEGWDTAFSIQAICSDPNDPIHTTQHFLQKSNEYLISSMMNEELPHYQNYYIDPIYGGFCFGDGAHRLPVSDCTAEALSAICLLRKHISQDKQFTTNQITNMIQFIFSRQNKDGGWSGYDRLNGGSLLEIFNPTEMFGDCMLDRSYVECTASCMHGLQQALHYFPELQLSESFKVIPETIKKGAIFLRKSQNKDGSWPGTWGINYIYGTLFGVIGLLSSGASSDDPAILKACEWMISKRLHDGGWGESWLGCRECRYIPHQHSQIIMTSWALITLLKANYPGKAAEIAINEGIAVLKKRQLANGDWPKESPAGVFFGTGILEYCLYKNYFPIWALSLYERRIVENR